MDEMGQTDYEKSYTDYYEEYLSKDESCVGERLSLLRKFQQALLNSGETLVAFETVSRELEKFRGQTSRELGLAYNGMIRISCQSGEFSRALEYASDAIDVFNELGDEKPLSMIYNNIAGVYLKMGDYEKSLEYAEKAIGLAERDNDELSLAKYLNNKGIAIENITEDGRGAQFIRKSIEIKERNSLKRDLPNSYMNLADIFLYTGREDEAVDLLRKAREVANQNCDDYSLAEICRYEAEYYKATGDFDSALASLEDSLEYHRSKGNKSEIFQKLKAISEIQEAKGDVEGALELYREMARLNSEIFREEEARVIAKLGASFAAMQKLREIENMTARNKELSEANKLIDRKNEELMNMQRELKSANDLLKQRTETDPLTGLMNQKKMFEVVEYEINRARRYGDALSIIMLDIDNFKELNDRLGHLKGDEILEIFSSLIVSEIRKIDYAFRYGGEEFVILLPSTALEGATSTAKRIRNSVEETDDLPITFSAGVTEWQSESAQGLLLRVDKLMYQAKSKGKNRIES
ncbi:diguanylate cyclase [Mesotoga sp.]|uniref:tetratricopeptide repeat-containing diguanylate cyclase n=2 Tax=Mesotoga TaxID=1184396 RepID=UPI003564D7D5